MPVYIEICLLILIERIQIKSSLELLAYIIFISQRGLKYNLSTVRKIKTHRRSTVRLRDNDQPFPSVTRTQCNHAFSSDTF